MDLHQLLETAIRGAHNVAQFAITLASYAIGWAVFGTGIWMWVKWSNPQRQYGGSSVLIRVVVGAFLINAASWLNMVTLTVTGYGLPPMNSLSIVSSGKSIPEMVFAVALVWLSALGFVAVIRGTTLLIKAGDNFGRPVPSEQDPLWTGLIYIVSGGIGINIARFASGWV